MKVVCSVGLDCCWLFIPMLGLLDTILYSFKNSNLASFPRFRLVLDPDPLSTSNFSNTKSFSLNFSPIPTPDPECWFHVFFLSS